MICERRLTGGDLKYIFRSTIIRNNPSEPISLFQLGIPEQSLFESRKGLFIASHLFITRVGNERP